jgi:beta-phosphoglucomutase family hydrolase
MAKTKERSFISRAHFDAVIFDLDGVLTQTAKIHAISWKEMFDFFLLEYGKAVGKHFSPFDIKKDYPAYVDGKPRNEGVKGFLSARGIELPFGTPEDQADQETICGLGNRKNVIFNRYLKEKKVDVFEASIALVKGLKKMKFKVAVVSSSKNCTAILENAGIHELFDVQVDGNTAEKLHLKGKPEPDMFLHTAKVLHVDPKRTVVFEDSLAGIKAAAQGRFGYVVGVNRADIGKELKRNGAHSVILDLSEVKVDI